MSESIIVNKQYNAGDTKERDEFWGASNRIGEWGAAFEARGALKEMERSVSLDNYFIYHLFY